MGTVLKLRTAMSDVIEQVFAPDALASLTNSQRQIAEQRLELIRPALVELDAGITTTSLAKWLAAHSLQNISAVTFARYLSDYKKGGLFGLAPQYQGRIRKTCGWESRALHYYRLPSKPCKSTIARWLREDDGFADASDSRVRRYLDSVPAHIGSHSAVRVGAHFRNQNLKPYVVRDSSVLPVGLVYTTDGHQLDWYVQHPNTGKHFRPEFTPVMDVRSHFIAGWWLGEAESAINTLYAFTSAIARHDHVPGMVHVDPGPGFDNKIVDEIRERIGLEVIFALPGNAKGKGLIEGFFHWFEERCGKKQPSYCGKKVPQELMRRLDRRIATGDLVIPSWENTVQAIRDYVERHNITPQESLGGRTPTELWAEREKNPLHLDPRSLIRPRERRMSRRFGISLFNRIYRSPALAAYEGRDVLVEYDLHDASRVTLHTLEGRYIADAQLVEAKPWLPESRIEDLKEKRLAGQRKRLQAHLDEATARSRDAISHDANLDEISAGLPALDNEQQKTDAALLHDTGFEPSHAGSEPALDIYDTSYADDNQEKSNHEQ